MNEEFRQLRLRLFDASKAWRGKNDMTSGIMCLTDEDARVLTLASLNDVGEELLHKILTQGVERALMERTLLGYVVSFGHAKTEVRGYSEVREERRAKEPRE